MVEVVLFCMIWLAIFALFAGIGMCDWYRNRRAQQEIERALGRYYAGEFPRRQRSYGPDGKPWPWDRRRDEH